MYELCYKQLWLKQQEKNKKTPICQISFFINVNKNANLPLCVHTSWHQSDPCNQ